MIVSVSRRRELGFRILIELYLGFKEISAQIDEYPREYLLLVFEAVNKNCS